MVSKVPGQCRTSVRQISVELLALPAAHTLWLLSRISQTSVFLQFWLPYRVLRCWYCFCHWKKIRGHERLQRRNKGHVLCGVLDEAGLPSEPQSSMSSKKVGRKVEEKMSSGGSSAEYFDGKQKGDGAKRKPAIICSRRWGGSRLESFHPRREVTCFQHGEPGKRPSKEKPHAGPDGHQHQQQRLHPSSSGGSSGNTSIPITIKKMIAVIPMTPRTIEKVLWVV